MGKSYETLVYMGHMCGSYRDTSTHTHTLYMYVTLITCIPHAYSTQEKLSILTICPDGVEIKHGCVKERLRGEL